MKQHTKEPWSHAYRENSKGMCAEEVFDTDGNVIATMAWHQVKSGNVTTTDREANAHRIVACVNACAGINTEKLTRWVDPIEGTKGAPHGTWAQQLFDTWEALDAAIQQRDELLSACHDALNNLPPDGDCAALIRERIAIVTVAS